MTSSTGNSGLMRLVAAAFVYGFAHGGKVHDCGNAGEVLKKYARGHEGDFFFFCARSPCGESFDVIGADEAAVLKTQKIFKKDAEREGKLDEIVDALFFEEFETLDFEDLRADVEPVARIEGVGHRDGHLVFLSRAVQLTMITEVAGSALEPIRTAGTVAIYWVHCENCFDIDV